MLNNVSAGTSHSNTTHHNGVSSWCLLFFNNQSRRQTTDRLRIQNSKWQNHTAYKRSCPPLVFLGHIENFTLQNIHTATWQEAIQISQDGALSVASHRRRNVLGQHRQQFWKVASYYKWLHWLVIKIYNRALSQHYYHHFLVPLLII